MTYQVEHRNPFQDTESVHMAINIPLTPLIFRRRTDKWPVLEIAAHYLPKKCTHRPKVAWALPSDRYLRSLATPDFFRGGFCEEFFRFDPCSSEALVDRWRGDGESLFAFVAIEVWGRIFILGESVEEVSERLLRFTH
jgi:asparagine synthetase B (glutamine-hydrolysing)